MANAITKWRAARIVKAIEAGDNSLLERAVRNAQLNVKAWTDLAKYVVGPVPRNYDRRWASMSPAVLGAIDLIGWGVAELPIQVYDIARDGSLTPVAPNDPDQILVANRWLDYTTAMDGIEFLIRGAILDGKGVAFYSDGITHDLPRGIYPVEADLLTRTRIGGKRTYWLGATQSYTGLPVNPRRGDLLLLTYKEPWDNVTDESPLEQCWPAIRAGLAATNFAANYFEKGATANVLFTRKSDGPLGDFSKATALMRAVFDQMRAKGYREALLPDNMSAVPLGSNAREAELKDQRLYAAQETARALGLPTQVLDPSTGTYSNFAQAARFLAKPLRRWTKRLAMEITVTVWPQGNRCAKIDTSGLIEEPFRERAEGLVRAIGGPFMSVNEGRIKEGLEPYGDPEDEENPYNRPMSNPQPQVTIAAQNASADLNGARPSPARMKSRVTD